MLARIVGLWLGMGVDAICVRFDELYKLCTGAVVNARRELGVFASGGYPLDLLGRYVGDNRPQATIFDFRFERVADGSDPNVLVEGSTGHLYPRDPVSMGLDLVEVKVVAKPDLGVDEPFELVPLRQSPSRRIGNDGAVSEESHRPVEISSAFGVHQGVQKCRRLLLSAGCNADAVRRKQSHREPCRTRPHGTNLWMIPLRQWVVAANQQKFALEERRWTVTKHEHRGKTSLCSDAHHSDSRKGDGSAVPQPRGADAPRIVPSKFPAQHL